MTMKWIECYKDLIEELWCWDNWIGKYAKWGDECEFSVPQEIEMWTYDVAMSGDNPHMVLSSEDNSDATKCVPGYLWTSGAAATNPLSMPN